MKARKMLAVLLLVAMCVSFMAVSASAEVIVSDNVVIGGSQDVAAPETTPQAEPETNNDGTDGNVIIAESNYDDAQPQAEEPQTEASEAEQKETAKKDGPVQITRGNETLFFNSLQDAISNAVDGDYIVMTDNETIHAKGLSINSSVKIDLGGNTLTLIAGEGSKDRAAVYVKDTKNVTIENGIIDVQSSKDGENVYQYGNGINKAGEASLKMNCDFNYVGGGNNTVGNVLYGAGTYNFDPSANIDTEVNEVVDNGNGTWTVQEKTSKPVDPEPEVKYAAQIGEQKYEKFEDAVAAAKDGETVTMLMDAKAEAVSIDKNIVLDLGGKTLTANLTVPEGKSVEIKNGTVSGTIECMGTLTINAKATINVSGDAAQLNISDGGVYTLTAPEKKFNITGGMFDTDVTALAAEGYYAKANGDGTFSVAALAAANVTPATANFVEKNAPAEGLVFTFDVNASEVQSVKVDGTALNGGDKGEFEAAEKTITIKKAYLDTLPVGEHKIEFAVKNSTGAVATVKVEENAKLWIDNNSADEFVKGSDKDLVFRCNNEVTNPKMGNVAISGENVVINNNGANTTVALKAAYLNTDAFKAGETYTLSVDTAKGTVSANFNVVEKGSGVECTLTDANGNAPGTINYFKGEAEKGQNVDTTFKTSPAIRSVKLDGVELKAIENYTVTGNTVTIKKDAPAFQNTAAGAHKLSFEFDVPGKTITRDVDLMIYPSMVIVPTRYVQKSGVDVKITVSDKGDNLVAGTAADKLEYIPADGFSYDEANSCYVVKASYLDGKPVGTYYLGMTLNGKAVLGAITIAPAPAVSYNDSNKEGKWENNGGSLSFDVKPDVKDVYVDGVAVADKNYSVNDKNVLTLKYGFLDSLSYGKHKIIVTTSDGNTNELEFTTKCGIAPKNGDSHTKGGRKNLDFVCSDPIKKVMVGTETLKADMYTLSKDGKTLTLKADFMNKLRADRTFQLTVETTEGCIASTYFKILSPGAASGTPTTGDESGIMLWAAVLVLSGIGAVALIPRKKNQ